MLSRGRLVPAPLEPSLRARKLPSVAEGGRDADAKAETGDGGGGRAHRSTRPSLGSEESEVNKRNGYRFEFSTGEHLEQYYCRARQCHESLSDPCIFEYLGTNWDTDNIQKKNANLLELLPQKGNGVVYMIHLRNNEENGIWEKQYVGSSEDPKERIKQHLIRCSKNTKSRLGRVKEAVYCGKQIGISWIEIKPSFLRVGIEEMIIGLEKMKDKNALPWNRCPGKRNNRGSS